MQVITPTKGLAPRVAVRQARRVVCSAATETKIKLKDVPLKLEEGDMPLNTYSPKKPFTAKIKSVKRIVGPKVGLLA